MREGIRAVPPLRRHAMEERLLHVNGLVDEGQCL
jgi:hypothetical protein